jgi:hypothetical protein
VSGIVGNIGNHLSQKHHLISSSSNSTQIALPLLSTQMSTSSPSQRNSKAPSEGGDITSKTAPARTKPATAQHKAAAPRKTCQSSRPNATKDAPEAVVGSTKAGTSTFFLLTLIQVELCEQDTNQFPFQIVRSSFGSQLAATLSRIEREDKSGPRLQFATALNCVLVWTRARMAALPACERLNEQKTKQLVELSQWSGHISCTKPIDEVIIVPRQQIYRSGEVVVHELIARRNCPRVRFEPEPPIRDDELGRELG